MRQSSESGSGQVSALRSPNQTWIPRQIRDGTRLQRGMLDHYHGYRRLSTVRILHQHVHIPMNTQLSQDAEKALRLFCRLNHGEQPAEGELQGITADAVLELHAAGYIDLPVKLAKLEFPEDGTARVSLQRTGDILLSEAGKEFCDKRRF